MSTLNKVKREELLKSFNESCNPRIYGRWSIAQTLLEQGLYKSYKEAIKKEKLSNKEIQKWLKDKDERLDYLADKSIAIRILSSAMKQHKNVKVTIVD